MSLAMKARQKVKKKGSPKDKVFGCDLLEHLQASGQEVPQVLKSCADFVEEHGIVDGIYRLCGIASNVQKLRQEFDTERPPNLNKDTYLQDVHCVSSLCKAYFRELPNPLLTYQLYDKFADAVAIQLEEQRLFKIKDVLKDLPPPHYRTLEYLMRHLVHMASFCSHTNMHARNLAIVWAPNLLRSKDIEATGFNGTAAFMEVRIQSIVVEFILTHVEQLFGDVNLVGNESEGGATASLPPYSHEDYFRSLSYNIPSMLNQGDGPPQIRPYHTIIEISDHKRKGSVKTKKWKSIFNLGRSNHDSKRKLNKQDDIEENLGKIKLRPAKSMDSLSSAPYAADEVRKRSPKTLLPLRRESFGAQSNEDNKYTFKDGDGQQIQVEERNQNNPEYEEETTAKSEPTTPKPGRSSIIETPQGRSPKNAQSRAEKCVGVHISGPFSVTLPFHITSNLSRLTRGMECPSLNNPFEHQSLQRTCSKGESSGDENIDIMQLRALVYENDKEERLDTPTDTTDDMATNTETTRIALEVQDTFSFLDTQDANQEPTPLNTDNEEENTCLEATTSGYIERCFPADCDILEDDLRNVFLNDMIGAGMQVEEFSVEPPPDDLSTDDDSDQMYFIPTGCLEIEDQPKDFEDNSEDVYLSACNDLSPLIQEFEVPLEFLDTEASQHSSTALAEKSSEHPICEKRIEECNEIQSELQAHGTQEVTSHDTLCMTFARDSEESKANEMDYLTHCELSRSPENYVTIKSGDIPFANCVPEIFHEVHEIMQNNPSGSDLDFALCDNETIDPIPFEVIPAEYVIDHDAINETSSTEENISKLDNQTEHDNDLQWPPPPFVDTDCTATDSVTNKCLVESQVEYIPAAPQNVLQKVDYSNEIMDDKPNVDNKICSTQEYFMPTISKFPNQIQIRSINGIYPDGSVSMRLASTINKTQQVKSVPVVPPKPQFAKLPPALKSTIHVSPAFTTNQDTQHKQSENHSVEAADSCSGSLQKQRSSGWRSGGSVSFDTAVALAKERQSPVRRMQTYCIGDSYDAIETKDGNALHLQKLSLKPTGNRMGRPVSCVVRPNSNEVFKGKVINDAPSSTFLIHGSESTFCQESMQLTQELSPKNRLSFPRLGKRSSSEDETYHNSTQQRRSLL